MRENQNDFGYWLGWILAFVMAASFFIFAILQGRSIRETMCKPDEADCVRQWVAALGGWTAIVVAVPSILYLARQVKEADRQYRVTKFLELRRLRALSAHMITHVEKLKSISTERRKRFERLGVELSYQYVLDELSIFDGLILESHFLQFETEVFTPENSVTTMKAVAKVTADTLKHMSLNAPIKAHDKMLATSLFEAADQYYEAIGKQARIFLEETELFAVWESNR